MFSMDVLSIVCFYPYMKPRDMATATKNTICFTILISLFGIHTHLSGDYPV